MPEIIAEGPDIETASARYEERFRGGVGEYFLSTQREQILSLIAKPATEKSVLEVGGGHCQITEALLKAGYTVWVHGSNERALWKARELERRYEGRLRPVTGSMLRLPFEDKSFDVVIAIRLLAHVSEWRELLAEICRVSKQQVIIDFPPHGSFNIFYPILFRLKQRIEVTTRPYYRFPVSEVQKELAKGGFKTDKIKREFFLPMVLHRWLKLPRLSRRLEHAFSALGVTNVLGSPVILSAQKIIETYSISMFP